MKIAVVTGAAGGIGEAVVRRFCASGYSTAMIYHHSEERANALSSELRENGFDVIALKADITDSTQVNKAMQAVVNQYGHIDVLVNNAGIAKQQLFDTVTDNEWQQMVDTNLSGAFYCCRAVVPIMLKQKAGSIINISSMWGQVGASCEVSYSASKAGIIGLTKALAKELGPSGINVNCVAPGAVDTKMMSHFSAQDIAELCEEIPLGRLAKPDEIASAVAFFASNDAGYITGQVLGVNGGMVI